MPNQKWLGDISYIETLEGFLYLASLEDVYSRKIVDWAMTMALARRQPDAD